VYLKNLAVLPEKSVGRESNRQWKWLEAWLAGQLAVLFVVEDRSSGFALKTRNWCIEFGSTKRLEENSLLRFHTMLLF